MLKKFVFLVCLSLGTLNCSAAVKYMTVELSSGTKYSFLLADKPVVTFESGDLVVNGSAETSYAISGVKDYHFTENDESTLTGETLTPAETGCFIFENNGVVSIRNAKPSANVALINVNGVVLAKTVADDGGSAEVKLPEPKGVYVLTIEKQSFKLIRK